MTNRRVVQGFGHIHVTNRFAGFNFSNAAAERLNVGHVAVATGFADLDLGNVSVAHGRARLDFGNHRGAYGFV